MRVRTLCAVIGLCLILTGCRAPSAAPAPAPSPQVGGAGGTQPLAPGPTASSRSPGCQKNWGPAPLGSVQSRSDLGIVFSGTCETYVDEDEVLVIFELPEGVSEQTALAGLSHNAPKPPRIEWAPGKPQSTLRLTFPAGNAGEVISVGLDGPVGVNGATAQLGHKLTRLPNPKVTTEISVAGGAWEPAKAGSVLENRPVAFRFTLNGEPDRAEIKRRLQHISPTVEEPDSRTLILRLAKPPAKLEFNFSDVGTARGLRIRDQRLVMYAGARPSLVAIDPATGKERTIGPAPVDTELGLLSPDGKHLLLGAYSPDREWEQTLFVTDLSTGQLRDTGIRIGHLYLVSAVWLPDRLVIAQSRKVTTWSIQTGKVETRNTRAELWGSLSPDGRYLAGWTVDYSREDWSTFLAPASLVLYDLQAGTEKVYPDLFIHRVGHKGGLPTPPMRWTEGGTTLEIAHGAKDTIRLDVRTGRSTPVAGGGEELLRANREGGGPTSGPGGWTVQKNWWGSLKLITPGGQEKELGEGLAVDWLPDGRLLAVRWDSYTARRIRQWE